MGLINQHNDFEYKKRFQNSNKANHYADGKLILFSFLGFYGDHQFHAKSKRKNNLKNKHLTCDY
jgi:hypothetical protein